MQAQKVECNTWKIKQILSERNDVSLDHLREFLGSLGGVSGDLGPLLEPLGSLSGGSWEPPGAILRPLGGSWGLSGRPLGLLERSLSGMLVQLDF